MTVWDFVSAGVCVFCIGSAIYTEIVSRRTEARLKAQADTRATRPHYPASRDGGAKKG